MRFINKERNSSLAFNAIVQQVFETPNHSGFDSLGKLKEQVREYLVTEQGGLCAYCNQKISTKTSTIEHLICQSHNPLFDLNYHNLYAVCRGNEGKTHNSHCDKFRANGSHNDYFVPFILFSKCVTKSWLEINPFFDIEYNKRTSFVSGKIVPKKSNLNGFPSVEMSIQYAIDVLNLNATVLVEARKSKWQAVWDTKNQMKYSWKELFEYYLNSTPKTDFIEFVLLAIRKHDD